jgi:prevent-host-death family protein
MWPDQAMKQVKIAELKDKLSQHLRAVERGAEIEVTDRSRPIARLVPIMDRTREVRILPATRSFASVRNRRYRPAGRGIDSLALLLEERGQR